MSTFKDCQIVLDLTTSIGFKKKQEIRKRITDNGGVISYIVTKKSTHVICNDPEKVEVSYKCKMATKYNIPVVSLDFIHDSAESSQLLDTDNYLIGSKTKAEKLSSGKVAVTKSQNVRKETKCSIDPHRIQVWHKKDKNIPYFDEQRCEMAKYSMFKKEERPGQTSFAVIEIHVSDDESLDKNSSDSYKYRVLIHYGSLDGINEGSEETREYQFVHTSDEALCVYSYLYQQQTQKRMNVTYEPISRHAGSEKFQKMMLTYGLELPKLSEPVGDLVEHIWREATGEIEEVISVPLQSLKLEQFKINQKNSKLFPKIFYCKLVAAGTLVSEHNIKVELRTKLVGGFRYDRYRQVVTVYRWLLGQVEEAEAILLRLKEQLSKNEDCKKLMEEFYKALPHRQKYQDYNCNKFWLSRKQEICQLIKDMVVVSEATDWSTKGNIEAKYKALRCHIEQMETYEWNYGFVKDLVSESKISDMNINIQNIYEVHRLVEDDHFRSELEPKMFLFHASKVENFVGILSRGLVLPKVVVDDLGGTRTDAGMLGNGIYFASSSSTSAKYSKASSNKGTRLMLINEVAIGKCMEYYKYDTSLEAPPSGYDSTHGVATSEVMQSEFKDDEYVIYNTNQQRMSYLVEFTLDDDHILERYTPESVEELFEDEEMEKDVIDLKDVIDVKDPMSKVKPGLVSNDDTLVELRSVHIRAKLVDLAGEVIVLQEYVNESSSPIEAKYVFPLDDMAAVCGFEAFINGKHIVGEVKEKETAHKEYKKAISEGHGAYLMDQDEETPDVFTVSVGNLPPKAFVLIKITYVTELQVEGEKISFSLPGSVAPWKQKYSLATEVKDKAWETVQVTEDECSVHVAVEMPFDIRKVECTTHRIKIKRTSTKAVIKMLPEQQLEDGFHLLISLAEIHVPRMWVESYDGDSDDDSDDKACMLTFYPEFEAEEDNRIEVIMLLDLSNSMKGSALSEAKKIILLILRHLPETATFNIVAFGTSFKELFPVSQLKVKANVKAAEKFLESCHASLGNTEAYRPLHSFFLLKPESSIKNMYLTSDSTYRNVFLISDGHINNEQTTLEAVYKNSQHTRIFTFGVSSIVNRHLLRALARIGAGAYEFFDSKAKSKWESKVKCQISKASQPGLTSVSVAWQQHDDDLPPPLQAPRQITALFNGSRQVVYGYVPNCLMATLYAEIAGQQISTVVSTSDLNVTKGKILHRLTAKAVIRDWEDGILSPDRTDHNVMKMNMKKDIIELSKKYSIVTKLTSFVAIEKRDGKEEDEEVSEDMWEDMMGDMLDDVSVDILSYIGFGDKEEDESSSGEYEEEMETYSDVSSESEEETDESMWGEYL